MIEDEYKGPALEDGKVTQKFMTDLLQTYREQGKLHRRYAYQVCLIYFYLLVSFLNFL